MITKVLKKIGCLLAIVVFAVVAAININLSSTERLTDIELANVEVLAENEGGEGYCILYCITTDRLKF